VGKIRQVIVVRKDLNMRQGKVAAQVAHASMKFLIDQAGGSHNRRMITDLTPEQDEWLFGGSFTKIVVYVNSEQELLDLIAKAKEAGVTVAPIVDEGLTEFNNIHTLTCAAFGPTTPENLKPITGHLPLL
jgi:PTH2 family peptidyl-tRNA hydrolase